MAVAVTVERLVEFTPVEGAKPKELYYATKLSSGIDLCACLRKGRVITLYPHQTVVVDTGYTCKLNPKYEGQIRPKSGLAAKNGITVLNAPGTIDADYEGEIKVILYNTSPDPFIIQHGDQIAQFVLARVLREEAYMKPEPKERGTGGLGSTGK